MKDWRYARSKSLMKALLDSEDSGGTEEGEDPEEDEDRIQNPKGDRMYARSEYLKRALLDYKDSRGSVDKKDPEEDEGSEDGDGAQAQAVGDATVHPDPDGLTSHSSGREDQTYVN